MFFEKNISVRIERSKLKVKVQVESTKSHLQGKQKALEDYQMFMRDLEKCLLFAIRLATTERIVRKFLVTMSTLVSWRTSTQNCWPIFAHYSVNWKNLNKSLQKLKVATMYLPLHANELNQVSLLSCVHVSGNKTLLNTRIILPWIETWCFSSER